MCAVPKNKLKTSCRKMRTTGGFAMSRRKGPKHHRKRIINEIAKLRSGKIMDKRVQFAKEVLIF